MVPKKETGADNKEILKQGDIDKLIEKLSEVSPCLAVDEVDTIGYLGE